MFDDPKHVAVPLPFRPVKRPAAFRPRVPGLGPDDNALCPCGSTRAARRCHWNRTAERWILPAYRPVHLGGRTGFSHPGCYARVSGDCNDKLSNEHTLGKAILTAFSDGKTVAIGERPFQVPGRIDKRTPKSLGTNILCERHNNALSRLDQAALEMISTLDHFYMDQAGSSANYGNEFDLFSGEEVERWMLKLVWGESESHPANPKIRGYGRRRQLSDFLFRDGQLPLNWGLYVTGRRSARSVNPEHGLNIRLEERDGELRSGSLDIGGLRLTFAIGARVPTAETAAIYRPSAVFLTRVDTDRHKVAGLSWDTPAAKAQSVLVSYEPAGQTTQPVGPNIA